MRKKRLLSFIYALFVSILVLYLASCGQAQEKSVPSSSTRPLHPVTSSTVVSKTSAEDPPARLRIPSLQIDAPVESVGVTPNGDLATPKLQPWTGVGWYAASPVPGSAGSSVIDGHLDRPGGAPAVFWNLHLLHVGDELQVVHRSGMIHTFIVTAVDAYAVHDVPLQAIFGAGGGQYLNLITCAGDWIPSQKQTTLRMVVYSSLAH